MATPPEINIFEVNNTPYITSEDLGKALLWMAQLPQAMGDRERLKLIRQQTGKSQQELANLLSTSLDRIKNIECGKSAIPLDIAEKIESAMGYSFRWILTGHGEIQAAVPSINITTLRRAIEFAERGAEGMGLTTQQRAELIAAVYQKFEAAI